MHFYVGITDERWFQTLKRREAEEANFWRPGATPFRNLELGGLFLFKLRYPTHAIVGGGHFVRYMQLPASVAWQAFEYDNGVAGADELKRRNIELAHGTANHDDPEIGCIILTGLFFFDEADWIVGPSDWARNIVSGKGYNSTDDEGQRIWAEVRQRLEQVGSVAQQSAVADSRVEYSISLGRRRLGQGAFRALVTDAYDRKCAVTGERTLPVLQAAHIKPVTREGAHMVQNGMLIRSDLHILYDQGLLAVDEDYQVLVSPEIKHRYSNGRNYYALAGQKLKVVPDEDDLRPAPELLAWHRDHVYLP